jgi:hypothetical protein
MQSPPEPRENAQSGLLCSELLLLRLGCFVARIFSTAKVSGRHGISLTRDMPCLII